MRRTDSSEYGGRAAATTPPMVLVAAASPELRAQVRGALVAHGHRVIEAEDGDGALAALHAAEPSVAVVDAALAAGWPTGTPAPVVVLTPPDGDGLAVPVAHDVLRTPVHPDELVLRVAAAVRTRTLRDELWRRDRDVDLLTRSDQLTGLYNRRHLDEQLRALGASAFRHGHPLAVLMVDIDEFQRVNDAGGHAFGDAVLCVVAARLRSAMRLEDVFGRWGGEEFLVLAPFSGGGDAAVLAERLRRRVGDEPVRLGEGPVVPVTVSVGLAAGDGSDPEGIVRAAGVALYAAKQHGRNRVERAAPAAPAPG